LKETLRSYNVIRVHDFCVDAAQALPAGGHQICTIGEDALPMTQAMFSGNDGRDVGEDNAPPSRRTTARSRSAPRHVMSVSAASFVRREQRDDRKCQPQG